MKKLLSPHTILTLIAFIVAFVFPYERVTAAVDASAISRYENATVKHFTSTIAYVNDYRSYHGRSALFISDTLNEAARLRAEEIARTGMFTHFDLDGRTFYKYFSESDAPNVACENISSSKSNVVSVSFIGWKNSPPHAECMLDDRMKHFGFYQIEVNRGTGNTNFVAVLIAGS